MDFSYEMIKNPEVFSVNQVPAHSDHSFYGDDKEVQTKKSRFVHSLNGVWKFAYAVNYNAALIGFEKVECDCHFWSDIRVPGHIQMEGYDVPQYVNVQYPWDGHEELEQGQVPVRFNPVASYVKYFHVPDSMKGERLFISFEGMESALALWLNGKFVGYCEDTFSVHDFELTEYVTEGENKLAVQVFKWTAGSWCEDQDFYRFSGLYRDVNLYTIPHIHIADLKVNTELNDTFTSGKLMVEAYLEYKDNRGICDGNMAGKISGAYVDIQLKDGSQVIAQSKADISDRIFCTFSLDHIKLWSAEKPDLYELLIRVYDGEDNLLEVVPQKVGFRRFEMKGNLMLLNGKRIVFKGTNRHNFSSLTGRGVSNEEIEKDIIVMKQNNINAIRTSHYPNPGILYDLCDKYGLYLISETNLESHGSWELVADGREIPENVIPGDRPEWLPLLLDRANNHYQQKKNHTSILIWSCGNESYGGYDIYQMSEFFRKVDPSRLVHYEGIFNDRRYNATSDMESQMYPSVAEIKKFLAEHRDKPFICCEYTHAMGNSCGAMHKYTDLTEEEPLYQGGFIWDYIDQSLTARNRFGEEFQAYGGDFGERPTDYNFSGNGIVYGGDREPSPKMQEVKFNYQNITAIVDKTSVRVINKNLFVNTSEFRCVVLLEKEGVFVKKEELMTDVEPLSEKTYKLPFEEVTESGEFCITVSFRLKSDTLWAKMGHEVAFGQYVYKNSHGNRDKNSHGNRDNNSHDNRDNNSDNGQSSKKPDIQMGRDCIGVTGEGFSVIFSNLKGGLVSYKYAGKEMIESIPRPNFWRAPVDNDYGNQMPARYGQWKLASQYAIYVDFRNPHKEWHSSVEEREDCVIVTYHYILPVKPEAVCSMAYVVQADGEVKVTLSYNPVKELGDMPEFGVMFKISADYNQLEWYGLGPAETYVDRCKGAKLGIYRNEVKDNMAQYLVPQECGNKLGVRYAKVTDKRGRGLMVYGDNLSFSALPYTPFEMENASHPYELPPVHYTVIRVAKQQMGIGGDDSWGARTHEEYLIDISKKLEFTFYFKGL